MKEKENSMKNILEKKLAEPCDDVLLYNIDQHISETTQSNVFFIKGNTHSIIGIVNAFPCKCSDIRIF